MKTGELNLEFTLTDEGNVNVGGTKLRTGDPLIDDLIEEMVDVLKRGIGEYEPAKKRVELKLIHCSQEEKS